MVMLDPIIEIHDLLFTLHEWFGIEWVILQEFYVSIALFLQLADVEATESTQFFDRIEGAVFTQPLPEIVVVLDFIFFLVETQHPLPIILPQFNEKARPCLPLFVDRDGLLLEINKGCAPEPRVLLHAVVEGHKEIAAGLSAVLDATQN